MKDSTIMRTPISLARTPIMVDFPYSDYVTQTELSVYCPTPEKYSVVYVPVDFDDWVGLKGVFYNLKNNGAYMRVVIGGRVPKEVLWAATFSEKNIIQMNVNMLDVEKSTRWVERTMILADKCGVYSVLVLNNMIPELVRVQQVLEVIDRLKCRGHFHTVIKFGGVNPGLSTDLSDKWLTCVGSRRFCSREYVDTCMRIVWEYAAPRKLLVYPCMEKEGEVCFQ